MTKEKENLRQQLAESIGEKEFPETSELITREIINGTPFQIVGSKETGHFITLGNLKLTRPLNLEDFCNTPEIILETMHWEITINLILGLTYAVTKEALLDEIKNHKS